MTAGASRDEVMLPGRVDGPASAAGRGIRAAWGEAALAVAAFAALCAVVVPIAPQAAEPDDGAYHASIVAITEGHFLTLSTVQARTLARKLDDNPAVPPNQWVEVRNGRWISEKDPGYPFLAAPFQKLGEIRWAPLFYGALACLGLFLGARRWLGRFRRPRRGRPVLLIRSRAGVRLARLHADVHRRLADRGRLRRPAVGGSGNRGQFPAAHLGRPRRVRGDRDRDLRPLHQYRDPRLRRRGRDRGVAAACHEAAPSHALLVARVGGRLRCGRGQSSTTSSTAAR